MFRWAHKDKDQNNHSAYSHKSCTQTRLETHVASPAHSKYSVNSLRDSSSKKSLKYVTPIKKNELKIVNCCTPYIQNSITKAQLINLVNQRKRNIQKCDKQINLQNKKQNLSDKGQIKIRIQVNKTINEYCRVLQQYQSKPWSIFVMGSILANMGFVEDLVKDRNLIKQIWHILNEPDALSLYAFIQQVLGNRVQIQMALKLLNDSCYFLISIKDFSKNSAILIITEKTGSFLYEELRNNRINRQKSIFSQQKTTDFSN